MKKTLLIITFSIGVLISFAQTMLDTAQNFAVKDIYGNNYDLFDILDSGKIVVIDFFSTT